MIIDVVVTLLAILALPVALLLQLLRPWDRHGGGPIDRLRSSEAVYNYDFWLMLRGVSAARRRDLRRELRANLAEATQRVGSREAIKAIGSTRKMATEAALDRGGPTWLLGLFAALLALELTVAQELWLMTAWGDAAIAAKAPRLDGAITLMPGLHAQYRQLDTGFGLQADLGPAPLVVAVLVFVLFARPWRLVRRQRSAVAAV